ncbi:hypothetical protein [Actinoplanes sp. NPDC026670]|uniref:hypothetical protein n=1 Tax=Actinoplanes sp. NPDC026670 TaxID=3154700 RepID=UPI0033C81EE8
MIEAGRRELRRVRESAEAWPELRDDVRRATVLWALQYDRQPGDLALVRWLAAEEVRCRRSDGFQGLTDEAELAGFLLAEYRQVEDVWTQWELKRANFDTWCGYDVEHLFAAGVQTTIDFVRGSGHPYQKEVLERLLDEDGEPAMSEDDIAEWADDRRARFPADPAAEDPLTWVERAKVTGDRVLAREWLDRWSANRPRDRGTLSQLRYQLADLDAFAEAAAAQRELAGFADSAWDRASAWQDLAGLERQAGDLGAAWTALRECGRALDDVSGWTEVGLGRMFVHELFQLAAAAGDDLAGVVFAEADRQAAIVPRLPVVVLRDAVAAAQQAGDQDRAGHYERLRDAEQARIDA